MRFQKYLVWALYCSLYICLYTLDSIHTSQCSRRILADGMTFFVTMLCLCCFIDLLLIDCFCEATDRITTLEEFLGD